jgi:hypothetical protein
MFGCFLWDIEVIYLLSESKVHPCSSEFVNLKELSITSGKAAWLAYLVCFTIASCIYIIFLQKYEANS